MAVAVSMAKDGRDVHPFFIPKTIVGHPAERGFDENDKPRKRKRTKSSRPDPAIISPLWPIGSGDQLYAIRPGSLPGPDAAHRSTSHQGERNIDRTVQTQESRGTPGPNLSNNNESQNASSTSSPHQINEGIALAEEILQLAGSDSTKDTAKPSPKKMLRVRSDGKLSSPKAKASAQDVKPKRGRKSAKAGTVPKTLVTIVRYGADAQSRSSMGCKISSIMSGKASNSSPAKSKPGKAFDPPKPTHPFFLGGPKRDQCPQGSTERKDDKEAGTGDPPVTTKRGAATPTKARVTSKPLDAADRSARLFGFGGNTFSSEHARVSRFPGALEPSWPPEGMVHIRQDHETAETSIPTSPFLNTSKKRRKMKEAEVRIPKEEQILTRYTDIVQAYRNDDEVSRRVHSREGREFQRPLRRVMTGRELQQALRREIASKTQSPDLDLTERQNGDGRGFPQMTQTPLHPAVHHMYNQIATSLTAFDKFECETQDWVHKYAPNCADQVLQAGSEVLIIRDWLKTLTINSVGFRAHGPSKTRDSSASSRRATTKRKRRRAEELDGFVLSSDEEANEMCQLTNSTDYNPTMSMQKKSVIRTRDAENSSNGERLSNAVVISGPHGCGKTAAVHAVARELGFEVFEINAGSRRSGRDIWDKVGDMTRNHLVKNGPSEQDADVHEEAENLNQISEKLKQDLDSGRQGTMNSFFKSKIVAKKGTPKKKSQVQNHSPKQDPPRKPKFQKQSLILLEEVDVLFDEDKTFWATTLELLIQSKRPVVMTCIDESLLPLEDMILHAILRFTHAPEQLATDYLLLVACNEGHMLPRDAVMNLYRTKEFDLRASMTELNFFCQMALGDTKGGLEWMLITPAPICSNEQNQESLRVVSEGTYQTGAGWLSAQHRTSLAGLSLDQEIEMFSEVWHGWGLDIGACRAYIWPSTTQGEASRTLALQQLQDLDQIAEAFSAADTFPGRLPMTPNMTILDTAQPELTEKARSNYIEGYSLLQADPVVDQTCVSEAIAFAIKACGRRLIHRGDKEINEIPVSNEKMISMITENMQTRHSERVKWRSGYAAVFEPIARSIKPVLGIPKGPQISAFDGTLSITTEDLAPYVRSIVAYDLRLEEQRGLLNSLLLQPGQSSKKQRTTRASRAALEGGSKAHTRRERWFLKSTNFEAVLHSGGQGWQDLALKQVMAELSEEEARRDEGSRRDSVGSASAKEGDN